MNPTDLFRDAVVAGDGIPLHFGDERGEYHAALEQAVVMDRSHEGRFEIVGNDRLSILHRISTNDLLTLDAGEGLPTLFTNAVARVLDRATVYQRGDRALVISEPGRGEALRRYLQKNIFFNDDARLIDLAGTTRQFVLHGPAADHIGSQFAPDLATMHSTDVTIAGIPVVILRDKPLSGSHWRIIVPNENAPDLWAALLAHGLTPAGSLTYNLLRIRAGRPGVGRELSTDYIPLELGLWDEVSFTKGCYTGQEIIARMESRGRLAKTIVTLKLSAEVEAPAKISADGHEVGMLTSSVLTPDGEAIGIGVVKVAQAQPGAILRIGDEISAEISGLPGAQPPNFAE
ncbi:MAG: glycine cleavage system protein T [Chloroflexota bacterium]